MQKSKKGAKSKSTKEKKKKKTRENNEELSTQEIKTTELTDVMIMDLEESQIDVYINPFVSNSPILYPQDIVLHSPNFVITHLYLVFFCSNSRH